MKSKFTVTLILFALVVIPAQSIACSCMYSGHFPEWSKNKPIIVKATVVNLRDKMEFPTDGYFEMEVDISSNVKGELSSSKITFYGSRGLSCNRYIKESEFPIGSEHFFALSSQAARHPLSGCAESSVSIDGEIVNRVESGRQGPPLEYEMNLEEFMKLLSE